MAEINVEKKSNIWPWIIGPVLLLLLSWGLAELIDNDGDVRRIPAKPAVSDPVTPAAGL